MWILRFVLFTNILMQYGHLALWLDVGQVEPETQHKQFFIKHEQQKYGTNFNSFHVKIYRRKKFPWFTFPCNLHIYFVGTVYASFYRKERAPYANWFKD
jgi:hypothetical protein